MPEGSAEQQTVVGQRYVIDRRLARGGMADIFLAYDQVLERPVVVKMLLPHYAADPAFVERFRREAQAAAKLNHPNVVSVFDWGAHTDTYFMAMEYVEGRSLADILVDEGAVAVDPALRIASSAAAGLGHAHQHEMVHRDVKPGNIMLSASGDVKVTDFGIARTMDGSDGLTQTGNVMGTAAYFSPEQARGETVDRRSDLYSLGVVIFEMVTGQRPFEGTSPISVAYKHVDEAPPVASSLNPALPLGVDAVIASLLSKNPDDRYGSAGELQLDLDRLVSGQPVTGPAVVAAAPPVEAATVAQPAYDGQAPPATAHYHDDRPPSRLGPAATPAGAVQRRGGGGGTLIMVLAAVLVAVIVGLVALALSRGDAGSDGTDAETEESPPSPPTLSSTEPPSTDPPGTGESSTTTSEPSTSSSSETTEPSTTSTTESTTTTTASTTTTTESTTTTTESTTTTTESTTTTAEETSTTAEASPTTPET